MANNTEQKKLGKVEKSSSDQKNKHLDKNRAEMLYFVIEGKWNLSTLRYCAFKEMRGFINSVIAHQTCRNRHTVEPIREERREKENVENKS